MKHNRQFAISPAVSVLESKAPGQSHRVPYLAPVGSYVETQWGLRKVLRHEPARYVDVTPDTPPGT
jgi:hypothetical protein